MPNNNTKMKFDAEFLDRCTHGIYATQAMHRAISPRIQSRVTLGQRTQCERVFQLIKNYAAANIGKNPVLPPYWSHDKTDLQIILNAKEAFIGLFRTVSAVKRIGLKAEYSHALELLNWFQTYLEGMAGNG